MDAFEQFARGGMDWLGLEPSETDVEIMRYIDMVFGEELRALLAADVSGWAPENDCDPSRAPRA